MQMSDGFLAVFIGSLDAHEIMARLGKAMLGHGEAVSDRGVRVAVDFTVTVRLPSPKSQVSSPSVVRNVRTMNVTGSPGLMPNVGQ